MGPISFHMGPISLYRSFPSCSRRIFSSIRLASKPKTAMDEFEAEKADT